MLCTARFPRDSMALLFANEHLASNEAPRTDFGDQNFKTLNTLYKDVAESYGAVLLYSVRVLSQHDHHL